MDALYIVLGIIAVVLFIVIKIYNDLVVARQRVREGWSDIETQLKRRYDLIPNLIETVKGYASHEKDTLEKVVQARANAMNNKGHGQEKAASENILTDALKSIFALSESYPDLKANENFMNVHDELVNTENKIQASRRFYNSMVLSMNTKVEMFPSNIIAGTFGFKKESFFEIDESEKAAASNAPKVSF
ncbi:MAG: LemA family protein [Lactobacillus sp.]|nr:LemA family protein [Lactobacillus sp.]